MPNPVRVTTRIKVKVENKGGILTPTNKQITLKNTLNELKSIMDIGDVDEPQLVDGATLVWNEITQKFEVKLLDIGDVEVDVDGGTF